MSTGPRFQTEVNTQLLTTQGLIIGCSSPPVPKPVIPSKRSDDDIQFISSKPVKRQRTSDQRPMPTFQQQPVPTLPIAPAPPVAIPPPEFKDPDRRISTGMVGLPSDFNVMELTCALRGVSLPVLEKFVLDQPSRGPRPLSPPELSPKQLPQTIAPAMLNTDANEHGPGSSEPHRAPVACMMTTHESPNESHTPPSTLTPSSALTQFPVLNKPTVDVKSPSPVLDRSPKVADQKGLAMPPPPLPRAEIPAVPKATLSKHTTQNAAQSDLMKNPCQICARMRQQANLAKAQGLPLLHHDMPHHMVSQMACHSPYSQHLHPHMMSMGPNAMHAFSSGFGPIMMPIHGNNFTALPSHMAGQTQMNQQGEGTVSQPEPQKSCDQFQHSPPPTAGIAKSSVNPNPVKPPASLIQPTYRKPSPNLIVDVAETCQEKFPFTEVAKRHGVSVEKVFEIFAAIIQVPLLRCPTDRRRAGKLATTRVKEYTRAKREIQETSSQGNPDLKGDIVVKPVDVANHLGLVDFPDGFNPEGPR